MVLFKILMKVQYYQQKKSVENQLRYEQTQKTKATQNEHITATIVTDREKKPRYLFGEQK